MIGIQSKIVSVVIGTLGKPDVRKLFKSKGEILILEVFCLVLLNLMFLSIKSGEAISKLNCCRLLAKVLFNLYLKKKSYLTSL